MLGRLAPELETDTMLDTYTLSDGSTNTVFGSKSKNSNSVTYYAPSARADLAGRPTLQVSHDVTNGGIARSTVTLRVPIYNEDKKTYDAFTRVNLTATQPASNPIADRQKLMAQLSDLITEAAADLVNGSL